MNSQSLVAAMAGRYIRVLNSNLLHMKLLFILLPLTSIPIVANDRCPGVAKSDFVIAFRNYFTRSGLRVSVVHLARSNAGVDEELYDHVCLETTAQKVADNQYRLSYVYKSISGFINVTLYPENRPVPGDEPRFVRVVPDGNLLAAIHCNPLEQIHGHMWQQVLLL
ncbi:uncharacterized protein LOC111254017 isoform X2 [Varroa destructor]|uniref:Uncharacterized protein n=1 Tax=Varroa destructor TaxID=109461 RepID=A0A7M7KSJ1_VARDE|nr:uncharacterized protein LOC111254017 isoform X2 [Varroa destructor]